MLKVLVTGGTGYLGRQVVTHLLETGYTARIMSRKPQPTDLQPGSEWAQAQMESEMELAEAVKGCDVIVHTATNPQQAQQIDVVGTQRLLKVAREAGVKHIVYISIVGIDRTPFPYYRYKLMVEEMIKSSDIPWSILRATQFHEFVDLLLQQAAKIPFVSLLPTDFKVQTVDAREVAQRLCKLVTSGPSGHAPDYAGPEVLTIGEMAHTWLTWQGMRRLIVPLWLPGKFARRVRRGENTCPDEPLRGQTTWSQWLQEQRYTPVTGGRNHASVS